MKIYAISDIHGYMEAFEQVLGEIDLSGDNKLVLLGDYIHGPNSYDVLEKIIGLQKEYGSSKVIALMGNHERMAVSGTWPINEDCYGNITEEYDDEKDAEYIEWMSELPLYYTEGDAIFVHAGIDEDAARDGFWELGTDEYTFTDKFPWEVGEIDNFDMKIVAGHVGTYNIANDTSYHGIYYDGANHYYIDGTVQVSGKIPLLIYDTNLETFSKISELGELTIYSYDEWSEL